MRLFLEHIWEDVNEESYTFFGGSCDEYFDDTYSDIQQYGVVENRKQLGRRLLQKVFQSRKQQPLNVLLTMSLIALVSGRASDLSREYLWSHSGQSVSIIHASNLCK